MPRQILVAQAQTSIERRPDASAQKTRSEAEYQNRVNANTVTVISGSVGGSFIRVAADLATVLDDGDEMRSSACSARRTAEHERHRLPERRRYRHRAQRYLGLSRQEGRHPQPAQASPTSPDCSSTRCISSPARTLRVSSNCAAKVNFDQEGSGANVLGTIVFEALNIPVDVLKVDAATGIEKLKSREIAATLDVVSKPSRDFQAIAAMPACTSFRSPIPAS